MGIGAVNYWANTEVKLFEREDGLELILQEMEKRDWDDDSDVLELGRLAVLAYEYLEKYPTVAGKMPLFEYLKARNVEVLFDVKCEELKKKIDLSAPKHPATFKDFQDWIALVLDLMALMRAYAQLRMLYRQKLKNLGGSQ